MFNSWFQLWYVYDNGFPQLFWPYLIVSMHQYVAHALYVVPIHFRVTGTVFKSQSIDSLAYYFDMFHQTEVDYGGRSALLP